ncbi:MAG: cob(I)yrinic acid a,c-diamide adenosyltransferase [Candidatus Sericytochromatia bacterium]|nr:cob(I)yrinic acid a,c-diamide adenosyltransferase [Candidatus Sericytochromatia bacterium]
MKIYTKTGDHGETALWGGQRVSKDALRIQAYGTVDECNAVLGLARTVSQSLPLDAFLAHLQNLLFVVGSDLASPVESAHIPRVTAQHVAELETDIDALEAALSPLTQFILPGGSPLAAYLHLARTVCRRAERLVVSLQQTDSQINPQVQVFLNRLSDWFFVAARAANHQLGQPDIPWQKPD